MRDFVILADKVDLVRKPVGIGDHGHFRIDHRDRDGGIPVRQPRLTVQGWWGGLMHHAHPSIASA